MLLLSICSFFVGFSVNDVINSKNENEVVTRVQYRIISGAAADKPEVGTVIHARIEVLK
jgi:hypothetical protein